MSNLLIIIWFAIALNVKITILHPYYKHLIISDKMFIIVRFLLSYHIIISLLLWEPMYLYLSNIIHKLYLYSCILQILGNIGWCIL